MVVLYLKRFWLAILIFTLFVVVSSFSSAQAPGCCCVDELDAYYHYDEYTTAESCALLPDGVFHPEATTSTECQQICAPACTFLSCDGENIERCACGDVIITPESTDKFCCASDSSQQLYVNSSSCGLLSDCEAVDFHTLTGFVYDQDGNAIQGATVTAENIYSGISDANGEYSIQDIPESNALTVTAGALDCVEASNTTEFLGDKVLDFTLSCGLITDACNNNLPGKCCAADYECVGGTPAGPLDCNTGWTCYEGCDSTDTCTEIDISGGVCSEGECSTPDNAHCEDGAWHVYDITNTNQLDIYCNYCGDVDGNCLHRPCQTSGACDGVCPPNCDFDDDYDCEPACDIDNKGWCDTYDTKQWLFVGPDLGIDEYCSHCNDPVNCEAECGNGEVEEFAGEECDPRDVQLPTNYCDENCQLKTPVTCGNGAIDSGIEECDLTAPGEQCRGAAYDGCNELCMCNRVCSTGKDPPQALRISLVAEEPAIFLTWGLPDTCESLIEKIVVKRCDIELCGVDIDNFPISIKELFISDSQNIKDEYYIDPERTYTYAVGIIYSDEPNNPYYSFANIITGHGDCMKEHKDHFCVGDYLYSCDDEGENFPNTYNDPEECTGYCFQKPGQDDECLGAGACEECSSLYGMYSKFALSLGYDFPSVYYYEEPGQTSETLDCLSLTESKICFEQKTNKSVEILSACANVTSCYDYRTENTCDSNPCGKFLDNTDNYQCTWDPYTASNSEFELGICHPIEPAQQNCSLCKTNNPIFPYCNRDLCNLYGNCYFAAKNNYDTRDLFYSECKGILDASCKDYDDEGDCIGGTNFSLNQSNQNILSKDFFGFGKCKWYSITERCYRDADDNADHVPGPTEGGLKDCDNDFVCERDFESPVTVIDNQRFHDDVVFGKNFTIPFFVTDNVYDSDNIETYMCIANISNLDYCSDAKDRYVDGSSYQKTQTTSLTRKFSESLNSQDNYSLSYFSQDSAKNLEVVNTLNFSVDARSPNYTFTYDYDSQEIFEDDWEWINFLTANFTFDELVTCTIRLKNSGGGDEEPIIDNEPPETKFHEEYNLSDGTYWFNINCTDDYGNAAIDNLQEVKVEGDISITNATPSFDKSYETEIELSVDTINNATCRYSTETYKYNNMPTTESHDSVNRVFEGPFDTSDSVQHTKIINFPGSGVYKFYTACEITYERQDETVKEITEDSDGDWIVFSVDRLKPVTVVNRTSSEPPLPKQEMDFNRYYQNVNLEFICVDPDYYKDENNKTWGLEGYGWDGSFGCEKIWFCKKNDTGVFECKWVEERWEVPVGGNEERNFEFSFQSLDKAPPSIHNKEDIRTVTVMIDPFPPDLTLVATQNGEVVETLTYGTYNIVVNSSKPIEDVVRFSYYIDYDSGASSPTISLVSQVQGLAEDNSFSANLTLDVARFYDEEGEIVFDIEVEDTHGMGNTETFRKDFDTLGPPAPQLKPIFKPSLYDDYRGSGQSYRDEHLNWYPFIYYDAVTVSDGTVYNNTYLIRDLNLFVTGYTTEIQGEVLFYTIKGLGDAFTPSKIYDQISLAGVQSSIEDMPLKLAANKDAEFVIIALESPTQSLSGQWAPGNYILFNPLEDRIARTDYENYGKFYEITASENLGVSGHKISFTPNLEENLKPGQTVYLFDNNYYYNWFGQNLDFDYSPAGDNFYKLVVGLNDTLNIGYTEEYFIYVDNAEPITTYYAPIGGTMDSNKQIIIEFKEHIGGSGLKNDSIRFEIKKDGDFFGSKIDTGLILTYPGESSGEYRIEYAPSAGWDGGQYNVTINIEDNAGNNLIGIPNSRIDFVVDGNIPAQPILTVNGTTEDNIDGSGRTVVDNAQPIFELDFTMEADGSVEFLNINITEVVLTDYETNTTITCNSDPMNLFTCSFNDALAEGLYSFVVSATKELPNGSIGPIGDYMQDSEGKLFTIIVDQTAPYFTLETERSYIKPDQALVITADVTNEDYDLLADVVVDGEEVILETEKSGNEYLFIISETFDWGEEGLKIINVTLSDYAGHYSKKNTTVNVDNTPPTINIVSVVGDRNFRTSNTNATVGDWEVTLIGEVSSDTTVLCYEQEGGETGCINKCVGEEQECIRQNSTDLSTFYLTLLVNGANSAETLNTVFVTLTDISGHETTGSLYILLDLEPPSVPEITFRDIS